MRLPIDTDEDCAIAFEKAIGIRNRLHTMEDVKNEMEFALEQHPLLGLIFAKEIVTEVLSWPNEKRIPALEFDVFDKAYQKWYPIITEKVKAK